MTNDGEIVGNVKSDSQGKDAKQSVQASPVTRRANLKRIFESVVSSFFFLSPPQDKNFP